MNDIASPPKTAEVFDLEFTFLGGVLQSFTVRPDEGDSLTVDADTSQIFLFFGRTEERVSINLANVLFSTRRSRQEAVRPARTK